MSQHANEWISVHAWYYDVDRQDELLDVCIRPLTESMRKDGLASRYFFIRYWAGGPHIRLRVVPEEGQELRCRAVMEHTLTAYLAENPSCPPPGTFNWGYRGVDPVADNTWQYVAYEPEVERYGGEEGIRFAEEHFHQSSIIAFDIIRRSRTSSDPAGAKIAYALQLASVLVLSAGFRGELAYRFFEDCLRHVYLDELDADDYPQVFRRLRGRLSDAFQRLEALEVDWGLADDPALQVWGRSSARICGALAECAGAGPSDWCRPLEHVGNTKAKYVRIVHSCVHMFFNRLGFWGRQEERLLRLSRDVWQRLTLE